MREALDSIRERIARAAESIGRDPSEVTLIAVSKMHSRDAVKEAYDLGLRHFGESRLQEAEAKVASLPGDIVWHFIGHLQSNKAKRVASMFDSIHTLDSDGQLREIDKAGRSIDGLIEVNIANETQKAGILPEALDGFHEKVLNCSHIRFQGLMTVGPALENPEGMRPYFRKLRELNEQADGKWLSMGMSSDFEVAIQEGATHVRIGSALFGSRI